MRPRRRPHSRNAFTLIELGLVLFILGLVAGLVLPRLNVGVLDRSRLRESVNRIAGTAMYARERAASTRRLHRLHLDAKKGEYWVTADPAGPRTEATAATGKQRLPDGVQFVEVETAGRTALADGIALRFSPEGWADAAALRVAGRSGMKTVLIRGFLGRVEVYDSGVGLDHTD